MFVLAECNWCWSKPRFRYSVTNQLSNTKNNKFLVTRPTALLIINPVNVSYYSNMLIRFLTHSMTLLNHVSTLSTNGPMNGDAIAPDTNSRQHDDATLHPWLSCDTHKIFH